VKEVPCGYSVAARFRMLTIWGEETRRAWELLLYRMAHVETSGEGAGEGNCNLGNPLKTQREKSRRVVRLHRQSHSGDVNVSPVRYVITTCAAV
jgi:hypothetical protein